MQLSSAGLTDEPVLKKASQIGLPPKHKKATQRQRAAALYFIGQALLKKRDPRGIQYLKSALGESPLRVRTWLALARARLVYAGDNQ